MPSLKKIKNIYFYFCTLKKSKSPFLTSQIVPTNINRPLKSSVEKVVSSISQRVRINKSSRKLRARINNWHRLLRAPFAIRFISFFSIRDKRAAQRVASAAGHRSSRVGGKTKARNAARKWFVAVVCNVTTIFYHEFWKTRVLTTSILRSCCNIQSRWHTQPF